MLRRTAVLALLTALPAGAAQFGEPDELLSLEVHGFASQGFIYSTHQNNWLARSRTGSFEFTEIGLNVTKQLLDSLRFGLQLFSRDLGPVGNYTIKPDWYYLDWRFRDWLGIRAGRVKLPFGLYNDTSDVDAARVPVLLPQSIYPAANRDFLLAQTGVELYGRIDFGLPGALEYRLYGGTVFIDLPDRQPGLLQILEFNVPYVVGGRLMWDTPLPGLRFGGSAQFLAVNGTVETNTMPPQQATFELPVLLWVISLEYAAHDLLVAVEYSRWHQVVQSSNPAVLPPNESVSERGYVMLSYRVKPWLTPGLYYSMLYPNAAVRTSRATELHDVAATLRFDLNEYWLVKLEGHFMSGTAGLNVPLNDGRPLSTLAPYWAAFFAKTTVHF
jgi:hypothetical protein